MLFSCLPGEVPEWSKGADCKSVGSAFEGSNPSLPKGSLFREPFFYFAKCDEFATLMKRGIRVNESFYAEGLRFECTNCSRCCRHEPGYVFLSEQDLNLLCRETGLERAAFVERYCRRIDIGGFHRLSLIEKDNYDCIFWRDGRCAVYEGRPLQCRTYPFWISNLESPADWELLKSSCPGAGRGRLYSEAEIDELLALRRANRLIEEPLQ